MDATSEAANLESSLFVGRGSSNLQSVMEDGQRSLCYGTTLGIDEFSLEQSAGQKTDI
jgi:hypothetical protein